MRITLLVPPEIFHTVSRIAKICLPRNALLLRLFCPAPYCSSYNNRGSYSSKDYGSHDVGSWKCRTALTPVILGMHPAPPLQIWQLTDFNEHWSGSSEDFSAPFLRKYTVPTLESTV